jgi:hypothetical protein
MKLPHYQTIKILAFVLCAAMIAAYWLDIINPILMFVVIFSFGALFAFFEFNQKSQ